MTAAAGDRKIRDRSPERKAVSVSPVTDEITDAAAGLVHAMARLVRAMDAVGDDGAAAVHIPDGTQEALEALAARVSAAKGFSG